MKHIREKEKEEVAGIIFMSFAFSFMLMEALLGSLLSAALFGLAGWFSYSLTHWVAGKEEVEDTSVSREKVIERLKKPEWIFFPSVFLIGVVVVTHGATEESFLAVITGTVISVAGFTGFNYFIKEKV